LRAFLRVIRAGESSQNDDAYTLMNGGAHFTSFADHPFARQSAPPGLACGAYQYIPHTWQRVAALIGAPDFSPPWQDLGAVCLIDGRGALANVLAGNLIAAMNQCRDEWVSLPAMNASHALSLFQGYGGTLASSASNASASSTAPIEEATPEPVQQEHTVATTAQSQGATPMPFLPILASLLPTVLNLFAPRAAAELGKVTQQPATVVQPFLADLFAKIGAATGVGPVQTDAQAITAVAELQKLKDSNAELVTQVESHALDYLDKVAPLLDKINTYDQSAWSAEEGSRNAAAARAIDQQKEGPLWNNPTFLLAVLMMGLVCVVVAAVLFKGGFSTDMQAFVIGAIVGGGLTAVLSFYFGSSRNSAAKDATISQLSAAKK
jgi:hypothetical protein